ncbi:MAG: FtsQ-type POTRA domain-containing protein [Deltaproteobacteria bacterium]|nr:FtsQ-type POTRA domain-containing protein [Deltaproteobacteria bacterium]
MSTNQRTRVGRSRSLLARFKSPRNRRLSSPTSATRRPLPAPKIVQPRRKVKISWLKGPMLVAGRITALVAVVGGASAGGFYAYRALAVSEHFSVKQLRIEGIEGQPAAALQRMLGQLQGVSIFKVDLRALAQAAVAHPWVRTARVRRELPDTLTLTVERHQPRAALLVDQLYLLNHRGEVFKRATPKEAMAVPIISGIDRSDVESRRAWVLLRIRQALEAIARYNENPRRPALGEINIAASEEIALTLRSGVTVRVGSTLSPEKLERFDAVWRALGEERTLARAVYLNNRVHQQRVTVRLRRN